MRACIHRGTKEIGGTCVELESQGKRIVLDVGLLLDVADPDMFPLHPIKGFDAPDPNLLGVVISRPHQDHYGLAHRLPKVYLLEIYFIFYMEIIVQFCPDALTALPGVMYFAGFRLVYEVRKSRPACVAN